MILGLSEQPGSTLSLAHQSVRHSQHFLGRTKSSLLRARRHSQNRSFGHHPQVECISLFSSHSTVEIGVRAGARQGHSRRGSQIIGSRVHMRSILPRLACQHSDGQKDQREVEDVCGLHGFKLGMPQEQLPTSMD